MGPTGPLLHTSKEPSAYELGVRAGGSLATILFGRGILTSVGTELAVAWLPSKAPAFQLNPALTAPLKQVLQSFERFSNGVDQVSSLDDPTKALLFQVTTTVGSTILSPGGTFAPYVASQFTVFIGRVGGALRLVNPNHFAAASGGFKQFAIQAAVGSATMFVAETARGLFGDGGATITYLAANVVVSPEMMKRIARSQIHKRIANGMVDLSASVIRKMVLKQPSQPAKERPSLIRRAVTWLFPSMAYVLQGT